MFVILCLCWRSRVKIYGCNDKYLGNTFPIFEIPQHFDKSVQSVLLSIICIGNTFHIRGWIGHTFYNVIGIKCESCSWKQKKNILLVMLFHYYKYRRSFSDKNKRYKLDCRLLSNHDSRQKSDLTYCIFSRSLDALQFQELCMRPNQHN